MRRIDLGCTMQAWHSVLYCASIAFCLASCTGANCSCIRGLNLCRQHRHRNGDCRVGVMLMKRLHNLCKEHALLCKNAT